MGGDYVSSLIPRWENSGDVYADSGLSCGLEPQMSLVDTGLMSHLCWLHPRSPAAMSWDHLPHTLRPLSQGPLLGTSKQQNSHCGDLTVYIDQVNISSAVGARGGAS